MNRGKEINELHKLSRDEMVKKAGKHLEILPSLDAMHEHMARDICDTIIANNKANKPTVFILPVGPTAQKLLSSPRR